MKVKIGVVEIGSIATKLEIWFFQSIRIIVNTLISFCAHHAVHKFWGIKC